jgi:hypothetical protein
MGRMGRYMKTALVVIAAAAAAIAVIVLAGALMHSHLHLAIFRAVRPGHWIVRR